MPRINSDVASITVGGVSSSGLRTSRNNSGLAPSSSRGTNSSERSTAYTTKSGYSLSTSFKDNIKWKRKKEPLKPSPSIDSVSTYQDSSATSSSGDGGGGGGSETDSSTGGTGQYSPNQVRSDVKKKSWRSLPKPDREQSNSLHDGVVEKRDLKGQRAALSSSSSNFYYNNSYANSYSNINTMLERKSPPIIITNSSSSDDISATVGDDANSSSTNNTSFQPKQLKTKFSFFKSLRSRKAPPDSLDLSAASPNNFDEYPKSAMTALSTQFHNDPDCLYPVFARPLEDAMNLNVPFESTDILSKVDSIDETICEVEYQKYIPLILFKCVKFITRYGLDEEGLYRVSGSSSDVQRLKKRFQNGKYGFFFFWSLPLCLLPLVFFFFFFLRALLLPSKKSVYMHIFLGFIMHTHSVRSVCEKKAEHVSELLVIYMPLSCFGNRPSEKTEWKTAERGSLLLWKVTNGIFFYRGASIRYRPGERGSSYSRVIIKVLFTRAAWRDFTG